MLSRVWGWALSPQEVSLNFDSIFSFEMDGYDETLQHDEVLAIKGALSLPSICASMLKQRTNQKYWEENREMCASVYLKSENEHLATAINIIGLITAYWAVKQFVVIKSDKGFWAAFNVSPKTEMLVVSAAVVFVCW